MDLVEAVANTGIRRHHVGDHDPPTRTTHPAHLAHGAFRLREVMDRGSTHDEVEAGVHERQAGDVALLQEHVLDPGIPQASRRRSEQRGCQVDADDLAHMGRDLLRDVRGTAGDVEHDHARLEGFQPGIDGGGAAREWCVLADEQPDLAFERSAGDRVVRAAVHDGHWYPPRVVTVYARPASSSPFAANPQLVEMRVTDEVRAGTIPYEGDDLVTGWHVHDLHQIEYAFAGVAEVETERAHYLLPPQQAVWVPAGLPHNTTLKQVRSVSVFFDPELVPGADDRARVLAAAPVIREMLIYAVRWPIGRSESDAVADAFFDALALLIADWLEDEAPLSLPTSSDPLIAAVMDHTNAHLDHVSARDVARAVGLSERTLRRQFPSATGMTWRQFLLQSRLLRSMAILAESTDRTVLDIATSVGFDSVSAFSRAFRRYTGETPSAYRRSRRDGALGTH